MSVAPDTEREKQSFAETALRLGGKTEEEARRMGAVDKADEQVETLFAPQYQTDQQPDPPGRLGRESRRSTCSSPPPLAANPPRATPPWSARWTSSAGAATTGTLYDAQRQGLATRPSTNWPRPATGAC